MREYEERKGMEMVLEGCEGEALPLAFLPAALPRWGAEKSQFSDEEMFNELLRIAHHCLN